MTDQLRSVVSPFYHLDEHANHEPLIALQETFTRSNGTMFSRIYERLTKASRRRQAMYSAGDYSLRGNDPLTEAAYRHGIKDALSALKTELS